MRDGGPDHFIVSGDRWHLTAGLKPVFQPLHLCGDCRVVRADLETHFVLIDRLYILLILREEAGKLEPQRGIFEPLTNLPTGC